MTAILFLWFVILSVSVHGTEICDLNDEECMTRGARNAFKALATGIKDLVEPFDPLYLAEIEGSTGTLQFHLTNNSLTGLSNCDVILLRCDPKKSTYELHLHCPQLIIDNFYEAKGSLGPMDVDGRGLGTTTIDDYQLVLRGNYSKFITDKDHKLHLTVNHHNVETNLKGKLKFESTYLIFGDKTKSDLVKAYINDNYIEMEKIARSQILEKFIIVLVEKINKYLKYFSVEEVIPKN